MNYISVADLNKDIIEMLPQIPPDIDLIVGIPRDGMLVATLISLYRNVPFTDVTSFCEGRIYEPGRRHLKESKYSATIKNVLLVDDICCSGSTMLEAKKKLLKTGGDFNLYTVAVYVIKDWHTHPKNLLSFYGRQLIPPNHYEWTIGDSIRFRNMYVDFDGVLCPNCTKEQDDDGKSYRDFLINTPVKFRPLYIKTIITGRQEKYRALTEAWLKGNHIGFGELIMRNPVKFKNYAQFKAHYYKNSSAELFVESSAKQAREIAQITGKQVLCIETNEVYKGNGLKRNKLNILLHVMFSNLPGGATISTYEIAMALSRRGHNVRIVEEGRGNADAPWQERGISDLLVKGQSISRLYKSSDIILVYWGMSREAIQLTARIPKPRVHFFCDRGSPEWLRVKDAALVVFNSHWLMEDTKWRGEQMVLYPPIYPEKYETIPGDGIMLISPIKPKGIDLFLEIAKRLPKHKFILVQGRVHSDKLPKDLPDNVEIIKHMPDARDVYSRARLILMPSRDDISPVKSPKYGIGPQNWVEGYGRTAIEAACSGIPTIGSRESKGLQECLGEGGMFCGQDDVDEWVNMILRLDNKVFYNKKSKYALKLAQERHPDKQIDELERRLIAICNRA